MLCIVYHFPRSAAVGGGYFVLLYVFRHSPAIPNCPYALAIQFPIHERAHLSLNCPFHGVASWPVIWRISNEPVNISPKGLLDS
jgi:hypothetical protein